MTLVIATLAIWGVWENLLAIWPWRLPVLLQPLLVYGAAGAFTYPDWRTSLAAAGGVLFLHLLVRDRMTETPPLPTGRVRGIPPLP